MNRRDPLWHPHVEPGEEPPAGVTMGVEPRLQPDDPPEPIIMPGPSYWPLFMAVGLLIATIGGLGFLTVALVGAAIAIVGLFGWAFEPVEGEH